MEIVIDSTVREGIFIVSYMKEKKVHVFILQSESIGNYSYKKSLKQSPHRTLFIFLLNNYLVHYERMFG